MSFPAFLVENWVCCMLRYNGRPLISVLSKNVSSETHLVGRPALMSMTWVMSMSVFGLLRAGVRLPMLRAGVSRLWLGGGLL